MSNSVPTTNNHSTVAEENRAFWIERLKNLQPLTIPYAKPAVSQNKQFVEQVAFFPDRLISMLEEFFPQHKPADVILAVFVSYLARISGMTCFDLGFADDELTQIVNLEGLFATYIPCRIEIDLEQDFTKIFNVVRQQIESAKQNKSYSLDLASKDPLLKALPGFDEGRIFPVAIERVANLENSPQHQFGRELTLTIPDSGQKCCWQYDPEILDRDSIDRMEEQLETLLQNIVANPQQSLAKLSLLPEQERQTILWDWNQSKLHFTQDKCIQQLFEEQVERTPEAIAVIDRDRQLTYRQLNDRANQLAHYLKDLGVAPEVLVGFCVDRSLEMIVGLLGILKAGGAYVPLDPAYPTERLSYMVEDAKISVLLSQSQLTSQLPEHQARVVYLDSDWDKIALHSRQNPQQVNTGDNLAYVIYTSGSTGKPKGVMIPHAALSSFAQTALTEYGIEASDRLLQFASINFDVAVEEIYTCLLSGSTLVVRTNEMIADLGTFCRACQDLQLSVLNLPTAYWHRLAHELANSEVDLPDCVRLVIIGGEKVLPEFVKSWQIYLNKAGKSDCLQLINSYGPTETTVSATMYRISANTSIAGEVPIGRPFPHLQTYILDRYRQPVPIGIPGELYIGGDGLARGYLNRPELTEEKFIPNFLDRKSARLYKTGDLVRYLPDSNIEYIGRIDKQVKIRGFRIELGEIETVIARHPDIQEVAVIDREDTPGEKKLAAYLVPKDREFKSSELRAFLAERLPNYMVPSAYAKLDSLPITPSGKIDRRALPAPDFSRSELGETFVAPRSDLELKLTSIWQEVLKLDSIGVKDNFFDLGGHSLLAVSLLTQVEKTFKQNIPLATFLTVPTIEGLTRAISQEESLASESLLFEIRAKGSKPPLFLINAMGTGMLAYKLLAKYLDLELPVYGIRAVGMDDNRVPHNRIEQMAEAYIEEIRSVQAEGPYFIAGVCTGGTVAFEMASILSSRGLEVAFLGLIDSTARPILSDGSTDAPAEETSPTFFDRYIKHNFMLRGLNNLFGVVKDPKLKLKDKLSFTSDMIEQLYKKIAYKIESITYKGNEQIPYQLRRSRVFDAGEEALAHYTPRTYKGSKVILIRANDNPEHIHQNYQLGWDEFVTEELEVYEIPADQTTLLFEPHIRTLAAKLNSCLAEIYSDRHSQ